MVLELRADFGAGKTTFVRGLVRGMGGDETVVSPSFTLSKIYWTDKGLEVHHFDFYRLSEAGIMSAQLSESLQNPRAVTVIEWGGIVLNALPERRLIVELKAAATKRNERQIVVHYPQSKSGLIEELKTQWAEAKS